jgi:hypothetical protein
MTEQIDDAVKKAFEGVEIPRSTIPTWRESIKAAFWEWVMWRVVAWKKRRAAGIKHIWKFYGYHGQGNLVTPYPMSERQALRWLKSSVDGAVTYIDREAGFIFYKPKQ